VVTPLFTIASDAGSCRSQNRIQASCGQLL
jgi:hypothetical protein